MANYVATRNTMNETSGFMRFSVWFNGIGSPMIANFGVGEKTTTEPKIFSEAINFSSLKLNSNTNSSIGTSFNFQGGGKPLLVNDGEFSGGCPTLNPFKGRDNCAGCSIAGDGWFNGRPTIALNHGITRLGDVMNDLGIKKATMHQSIDQITEIMTKLGNGSTGIVLGSVTAEDGHYFNVINNNGAIKFIDFQKINGSRLMQPVDFSRFKQFFFIQTNNK